MKHTRLALWLLLCAVLGLSATVSTLRMEMARDLHDIEGLAVRAGALERENAALKDRLGMIERGVLIRGKAYPIARHLLIEEPQVSTGSPYSGRDPFAPRVVNSGPIPLYDEREQLIPLGNYATEAQRRAKYIRDLEAMRDAGYTTELGGARYRGNGVSGGGDLRLSKRGVITKRDRLGTGRSQWVEYERLRERGQVD